MALFIYPAVEGNLGLSINNIYVAAYDDTVASLTETIMSDAGLNIGDVMLLNATDDTDLYKIGAAYALSKYDSTAI